MNWFVLVESFVHSLVYEIC